MEREALSKSINPYYRYDLEPFSVCIVIFNIVFSGGFPAGSAFCLYYCVFVSGEEEGFLATLYCVKAPSQIHSTTLAFIRWSCIPGNN